MFAAQEQCSPTNPSISFGNTAFYFSHANNANGQVSFSIVGWKVFRWGYENIWLQLTSKYW